MRSTYRPVSLTPLIAGLALLAAASASHAAGESGEADRPVWALGIGGTVISLPDYVGSDRRQLWRWPLPYVYYESRHVTIDRGIVTGGVALSERTRLSLSVGGSLPVDGEDNETRAGMADLDAIIEVGPALKYQAFASADRARTLSIELPVRSAIAVALDDVRHAGWLANPLVEYRSKHFDGDTSDGGQLTFQANTGPLLVSEAYAAYFYGVPAADARPGRAAYDADAGYGGWRVSLGLSRRWGDFWFGGFVRYINLDGAAFADSPLVRTSHYLVGGLASAWIFASSPERVRKRQ